MIPRVLLMADTKDLEKGGGGHESIVNTTVEIGSEMVIVNTTVKIDSAIVNLDEDLENGGMENESIVNTAVEIASANVNLDEDLEKGGMGNESIVNTTVETASANVNLDEDLEKGGTGNESIVNTTVEIGSAESVNLNEGIERLRIVNNRARLYEYNHRMRHSLFSCRMCNSFRVNNVIVETIDLGCACDGGFRQVHKVCAENWFRQRGHRCCRICRHRAQSMPIPDNGRDPEGSDNVLDGLVGWDFWLRRRLIAVVLCWVAMGIYHYKVQTNFFDGPYGHLAVWFTVLVLSLPLFVNVVIMCKLPPIPDHSY